MLVKWPEQQISNDIYVYFGNGALGIRRVSAQSFKADPTLCAHAEMSENLS